LDQQYEQAIKKREKTMVSLETVFRLYIVLEQENCVVSNPHFSL